MRSEATISTRRVLTVPGHACARASKTGASACARKRTCVRYACLSAGASALGLVCASVDACLPTHGVCARSMRERLCACWHDLCTCVYVHLRGCLCRCPCTCERACACGFVLVHVPVCVLHVRTCCTSDLAFGSRTRVVHGGLQQASICHCTHGGAIGVGRIVEGTRLALCLVCRISKPSPPAASCSPETAGPA